MEGKILFDISHLRFKDIDTVNVNDEQFFLSNVDKKRGEFYTEIFTKQYGQSDISYIPKSVFAYSFITMTETDRKLDEQIQMEFEEFMFERLQYVETLLTFLWFVKDNSIGLFSTIGEVTSKRIAGKLSKSISYWNCSGEKENVTFTPEELLEAASMTTKYNDLCSRKLKKIKDVIIPSEFDQYGKPYKKHLQRASNDFNYNEQNCVERAINFLVTARSQSIIIYRIAYYMAVIESLFTTSSNEITTKMCYRVAFYIGESPEECKSIFEAIRKSYNIRSKFLHGQKFEKNTDIELSNLLDISREIDKTLRRVFRKILTKDSEPFIDFTNKDRESYLNHLVWDLPFERKNVHQNGKR